MAELPQRLTSTPLAESAPRRLDLDDGMRLANHAHQPWQIDGTPEREVDLRAIWEILRRRKWAFWTFLFLVLAVVTPATFLATPIYRASLTLQIDRETSKVVSYQDVSPNEMGFEQDFYQTQYELLRSRSIAQRVVDELGLAQQPQYKAANSSLSKSFFGAESAQETTTGDLDRTDQHLVDVFLKSLSVVPVKRSRLVTLNFDNLDPVLAANVVNALAQNFINMNLERRFNASSYAKNFLEDQLRHVKVRLEGSEQALVNFARVHGIVHVDEKQPLLLQQLQQISVALAKTEQERIQAEAIDQEMQATEGVGLKQILASEVIQQLKQIKAKLDAEYQDQLRVFKPAYPRMTQLAGQITEIQAKIDEEVRNIRGATHSQYQVAQREQGKLEERMAELKEDILVLQDSSIQYTILKREVETNRQLYDGLLQRMKEVGVAGGVTVNNVSVVDPAVVPEQRFKPNISVNVMLAMLFGILGGVALVFALEYLDDTVKSPEDLERGDALPMLGVIPSTDYAAAAPLGLLSHLDPTAGFSEAYRSARTALTFSTVEGAPRVLLVTSSSPGEGKTTTAVNLATAFSQMGKTVLLVDTDLRKSSLHKVFGVENSSGLTNFLAGDTRPAEITRHTDIPCLFLITSGPLPPNPAELLASTKMAEFLSLAAQKFDCVILDGPPVMGLADAPLLANLAQATLLVVESGGTRRAHLTTALKRLRSAHANVLGGVLSKYRGRSGRYDYYDNYYYYGQKNPPAANLLT